MTVWYAYFYIKVTSFPEVYVEKICDNYYMPSLHIVYFIKLLCAG
jgi:hypothetical protein